MVDFFLIYFLINPLYESSLVSKPVTTKYKYFKERSPWGNTKVLGIKDLFDPLIPSE